VKSIAQEHWPDAFEYLYKPRIAEL